MGGSRKQALSWCCWRPLSGGQRPGCSVCHQTTALTDHLCIALGSFDKGHTVRPMGLLGQPRIEVNFPSLDSSIWSPWGHLDARCASARTALWPVLVPPYHFPVMAAVATTHAVSCLRVSPHCLLGIPTTLPCGATVTTQLNMLSLSRATSIAFARLAIDGCIH